MAYLAVPQQKNEQPSAEKEAADKEGEYTREMQDIFGASLRFAWIVQGL